MRNRSAPSSLGTGRPSYEQARPLRLAEIPPDPKFEAMVLDKNNSYVRAYTLGECTVSVTKEFGDWHLSIAHPRRYPTWDEVAEARYRLLPADRTFAMLLPPKDQYINIHNFCFQLLEVDPETRHGDREHGVGGAVLLGGQPAPERTGGGDPVPMVETDR
jgi:hypothetical protein